jgi:hypothetical protein
VNPAMTKVGLALMSATREVLPCPAPGIYPDVDAETYHKWDAASASRLKLLKRSPAHLKEYLDNGREDTDAFRIGRAFHAAVLEPDLFETRYGVASYGCDRRSKAGKDEWAALETTFGDGFVLKHHEHADIIRMRDNVLLHPRAKKLFTGEGRNELSMVWDDVETGVRCKMRADRYHPTLTPGGCIGDLKSTRDASARAFERSAYDTGIYMQGALYLTGSNANGLGAEHFAVIAVEKEPPYCVQAFVATPGMLSAGEEQFKTLLKTYAQCVKTGRWPGYAETFQPLDLPHYGYGQVDEEVDATP